MYSATMLLVPDQVSLTLRIWSSVRTNMLLSFPKYLPCHNLCYRLLFPISVRFFWDKVQLCGCTAQGTDFLPVQKLLLRKWFLSAPAKIKNGSLNISSLSHICCRPTFKLFVESSIWLLSKFRTWVNPKISVYFSASSLRAPSVAPAFS